MKRVKDFFGSQRHIWSDIRTGEAILCQREGRDVSGNSSRLSKQEGVGLPERLWENKVLSSPPPPPTLLYVITVLPNEDTVCIFRPRMVACFLALSSLLPVLLALKETHFPTLHPSLLRSS